MSPTPPRRLTAADVGDMLVMSYAADPRQTFEGRPTSAGAAISWPALYLAHDSRLRNLVVLWAWCRSHREPFEPKALERGWSSGSARRAVERGLELIADGLDGQA